MKYYKADLHVHTVLSPCGDLEMSPGNIIARAREVGLDIIGIADHNSTKNARLARELGKREGITVLCGAEVNTREEVHCLTFFEQDDELEDFQQFLDQHLPTVKNDPKRFGFQAVVNEKDEVMEEIDNLLISALDVGIEAIEQEVRKRNGLFIPAHVDRMYNGLIGQLGFMPASLSPDAIEVYRETHAEAFLETQPELQKFPVIRSSDAHFLDDIGAASTGFLMETPGFNELKGIFRDKGMDKIKRP
jgi:hypothetical protein